VNRTDGRDICGYLRNQCARHYAEHEA
jgi:hypothetical protein